MHYPQTAIDLIHWDMPREHDTYGWFNVITGYEGTGRCFWCGEPIEGRRRYCRRRKGCWTRYQEHFNWIFAAHKALRESDYTCANCGLQLYRAYWNTTRRLEVHHIIPLNGEGRAMHVYNIFWNLIVLCRDCHLLIHAAMRPPKLAKGAVDSWGDAEKIGQSIMNLTP